MYCEQFAERIAMRSPCLAPFSCRTVASRLQRDHNCRYVMRWSSKMTAIRSGAVCIARFRGSTNVGITARLFFARSNREIPVRDIPHQVRGAFYSCGYEHRFPPGISNIRASHLRTRSCGQRSNISYERKIIRCGGASAGVGRWAERDSLLPDLCRLRNGNRAHVRITDVH